MMTESQRADALAELRRAHDQVQPPVANEKGAPDRKDRTGCLCTLSPRVVAWLIEELEQRARAALGVE